MRRRMTSRTVVRTVVTLAMALCVITMFAGSAAALINVDTDEEQEESGGLVDVDTGLDSDASQDGGGGSGGLAVSTSQGGAGGVGSVEADATDPSLTIGAEGEGGPAGNQMNASVECTLGPSAAEDPQSVCETDTPGSIPSPGEGIPSPGDSLPSPGEGIPSPGDSLPSIGDGVPSPGDGVPGVGSLLSL